jgi:hypothetical protein
MIALALPLALAAALPHSASAAYKECEFTKKKAKQHKAPRCKRDLGKSRWIVVSGAWKEKLTISEQRDNATFQGTGEANLVAGGLNGNSAFPSRRQPTVSMVSTRAGGVEFDASSEGGWTSNDRYYDCSFNAPPNSEPNGFGGIFTLKGKTKVSVQWILGGTGFGCADGPYGTPSPDFPDPVATYALKQFRNKRLVRLPIAFDFTDAKEGFNARVTYDGIARLRRYR